MEIASNYKNKGVHVEPIWMRLFVHTLKDKARESLDALATESINSQGKFVQKLPTKLFSTC